MPFKYQSILSIFISSTILSGVLPSSLVSAQSPQINNNQNSERIAKHAAEIQSDIYYSQQVKTFCSNARKIDFELTGDKLLIITGNHFCSYTIVKEVLQPLLKVGKIRTYAFTGDQEDVIVTF